MHTTNPFLLILQRFIYNKLICYNNKYDLLKYQTQFVNLTIKLVSAANDVIKLFVKLTKNISVTKNVTVMKCIQQTPFC